MTRHVRDWPRSPDTVATPSDSHAGCQPAQAHPRAVGTCQASAQNAAPGRAGRHQDVARACRSARRLSGSAIDADARHHVHTSRTAHSRLCPDCPLTARRPSPRRGRAYGRAPADTSPQAWPRDILSGARSNFNFACDRIVIPLHVGIVAPSPRLLGGHSVLAERLIQGWNGHAEIRAKLLPINPLPPPCFGIVRTMYTARCCSGRCRRPRDGAGS